MGDWTRRRFLRRGLELGAGAFLAGCAGPVREDPNPGFLALDLDGQVGRVHLARYAPDAWAQACEELIPAITDLAWLKPGDRVFLKVASNSANTHPAVTSPHAIRAVTRFLRDAGAGEVIVGDQAGVQSVRLTPAGRESSTREVFAENGILAAIEDVEATCHCFDDQGWDGYARAEFDGPNVWDEQLYLPRILDEVDHVVYLPRLATHTLAGYTCAAKLAVGWLRDDSRKHLHQQAGTFFEQTAEINLAPPIRDKLRFSLSLGDGALLNIGPDIGSHYDFEGVVGVGAERIVDHDLLASAMLIWLDRDDTSFWDVYAPYPEHADHWNSYLVELIWGEQALERYVPLHPYELERGLAYDVCLSHLALRQGYRPAQIEVVRTGGVDSGLARYLRTFGDGIFAV